MKCLKITLCNALLCTLVSCSPKMSDTDKTKATYCFRNLKLILVESKCAMVDNPETLDVHAIMKKITEQTKLESDIFSGNTTYDINPDIAKWRNMKSFKKDIAVCCEVDFYPPSYNIHYLGVCFDGALKKLKNPPDWYITQSTPTTNTKDEQDKKPSSIKDGADK